LPHAELSSLFAGLLAFQNSAARYFYSLGRAGVLPRGLDRVNGRGAPIVGAFATSVIALVVILLFVVTLVMARFGLLAGTVAEGVDPTTQSFGLSTTGWTLVLAPYVVFVVGMIVGQVRPKAENQDAVADLVT